MKKTITTTILSTAFLTLASAAEFLEVTSLQSINGITTAQVKRYSTENLSSFTGNYLFQGNLSIQEAVTKMSYFADEYVTVTGKNASSTTGKVNTFAKLRSDAWYSKGLTGYFVELARQMDLMK